MNSLLSLINSTWSTPTFMPSDVNVCREYQYEACCSLDTVRKCVVFFTKTLLFRERLL